VVWIDDREAGSFTPAPTPAPWKPLVRPAWSLPPGTSQISFTGNAVGQLQIASVLITGANQPILTGQAGRRRSRARSGRARRRRRRRGRAADPAKPADPVNQVQPVQAGRRRPAAEPAKPRSRWRAAARSLTSWT